MASEDLLNSDNELHRDLHDLKDFELEYVDDSTPVVIRPEKDLSLWKQVSSFECNEIKELPLKDKDEE